MTGGFTKLFNTILTSSVWQEPDPVRIVWITLLALANKDGEISAALPGLAHVARVSQSDTETAIAKLSGPDEHSRTKDNGGRRIEQIDGGWRILNYAKYRGILCEQDRREYKARWIKEKRRMSTNVDNVDIGRGRSIEQRAEASTSSKEDVGNVDFVSLLSADSTYAGIDVPREFGKMQNWCKVNNKQPTKRRFINWLNRVDRPIATTSKPTDDWRRYDKQGRRVDASGRLMDSNQIREADMLHEWEEERRAAKAKV